MNDVQYAVHNVAEFSKFSGLVLNKNKTEALMIDETITSVTSLTHLGPDCTNLSSHNYTSTHTKPTRLPHLHHRGILWHQWKNQPSITPFTQYPQQTSPLWRIYFQRKHTSSYIKSRQPSHKSLRPNSLLTRTPHHLYNTTLKPSHMEPHTPQPTQNSNAWILPAIPWDATQLNEHNQRHQHKHYIYQPIKTCLHTKISLHNYHKTWQEQKHRIHYSRLVDWVPPTVCEVGLCQDTHASYHKE